MSEPRAFESRQANTVHYLTIDRAHRRNALTPAIAHALSQEIGRVAGEGGTQALVLAGAGGHFCAGLDLHWFQSLGGIPAPADLARGLRAFQSLILAIVKAPFPVVAVVQGTVAGFGLDLAAACDGRAASRSATFTSAFARMGLVPDGGSTFTLPRLVGLGRAHRLLLGGETIDATTALAIGLVDSVTEPAAPSAPGQDAEPTLETTAEPLLRGILSAAPTSLTAIKQLTRQQDLDALERALAAEGEMQLRALQSAAFHERLAAFAARTGSSTGGASPSRPPLERP